MDFSRLHSLNTLSFLHIALLEMLTLSLLNIALSSAIDLPHSDFTKRWNDPYKDHWISFILGDWSPLSFQVLIMRWTVFQPTWTVSAVSLYRFQSLNPFYLTLLRHNRREMVWLFRQAFKYYQIKTSQALNPFVLNEIFKNILPFLHSCFSSHWSVLS